MSVDICFNKNAALRAGITTKLIANATPEDIARARREDPHSEEYLKWLTEEQLCLRVPNVAHEVYIRLFEGGHLPAGLEDIPSNWIPQYNVQSRRYRSVLIEWFTENGIEWSEH